MGNLNNLYNEMIAYDRFELYKYYEVLCNAYLYKLKKLWDISDESIQWVVIGVEANYGWDYYIPMRDIIFIVCNNVSEKEYFEKIYYHRKSYAVLDGKRRERKPVRV